MGFKGKEKKKEAIQLFFFRYQTANNNVNIHMAWMKSGNVGSCETNATASRFDLVFGSDLKWRTGTNIWRWSAVVNLAENLRTRRGSDSSENVHVHEIRLCRWVPDFWIIEKSTKRGNLIALNALAPLNRLRSPSLAFAVFDEVSNFSDWWQTSDSMSSNRNESVENVNAMLRFRPRYGDGERCGKVFSAGEALKVG